MSTGIRYPSYLPVPERDSYEDTFDETRQRSSMETGVDRVRRVRRAAPRRMTIVLNLTQAEYTMFDTWYQNDLQGGALPFDMPLSNDNGGLIFYTVLGIGDEPTHQLLDSYSDSWQVNWTVWSKDPPFALRDSGTDRLAGIGNFTLLGSATANVIRVMYGLGDFEVVGTSRFANPLYGSGSLNLSGLSRWSNEIFQGRGLFGLSGGGQMNLLPTLYGRENFTLTGTGALHDGARPYDSVSAAPAVAYGLRRLFTSYTSPLIKIQRSSDQTTLDIGYDSNGNLDVAAISTFCGTGSGYVQYWYDQSGNGNHANQTNYSPTPLIWNAGTLVTQPGPDGTPTPMIWFQPGKYLLFANTGVLWDDWTHTQVFQDSQSGGSGAWYTCPMFVYGERSGLVTDFGIINYGGKMAVGTGDTVHNADVMAAGTHSFLDNLVHVGVTTRSSSTGVVTVYLDENAGDSSTIATGTRSATAPNVTIGDSNASFEMTEFIVWPSVLGSSDLSAIRDAGLALQVAAPPTTAPKLLLHFEGTSIVDSSDYEQVVFNHGTTLDSTNYKFGSGSCAVSGGYLSTSSAVYVIGTADFTVDCWLRPTSFSSEKIFFDNRDTGTAPSDRGFNILIKTGGYIGLYDNSTIISSQDSGQSGIQLSLNTWQHVQVCRSSGTIYIFVNGILAVQSTTNQFSNNFQSPNVVIGAAQYTPAGAESFPGNIDEFRFLVGQCANTSNFTPPTAPYAAE